MSQTRKQLIFNYFQDFTEANVPDDVLQKSKVYLNGRDVEGRQVLIIALNHHRKGVHPGEDLKKNVVYWMERAIRLPLTN